MGLQMQLMVYLKDAVDYEKKKNPDKSVVPAGGLYFHIHDPYVEKPDFNQMIAEYRMQNPDTTLEDESIKYELVKKLQYRQYRMTGMVNADSDVVRLMDKEVFDRRGASDILPVSSTKAGLSSSSQVLDSETYTRFINYVSDKAEKMKEQIIEGDISINPVEGACAYCLYGGVCGFDRKLGDKYREVEKVTLSEIKDMLSENSETQAE
jgi:ATP-dependent helicase/nuclease subunit B